MIPFSRNFSVFSVILLEKQLRLQYPCLSLGQKTAWFSFLNISSFFREITVIVTNQSVMVKVAQNVDQVCINCTCDKQALSNLNKDFFKQIQLNFSTA